MLASHVYMWPLALAVGGTIVTSGLRYLLLFIGFRTVLAKADKGDYMLIYREFARALKYDVGMPLVIARRGRCRDGRGHDC